jgi:hypothetical protein
MSIMHITVGMHSMYWQLLLSVVESEYALASTHACHLVRVVQKKRKIANDFSRVRALSRIHMTQILNENDDSW